MTQLTISIPDDKLSFIMELFNSLGFVKIKSLNGKPYIIELVKEGINS